jgi:hypothetical protein
LITLQHCATAISEAQDSSRPATRLIDATFAGWFKQAHFQQF